MQELGSVEPPGISNKTRWHKRQRYVGHGECSADDVEVIFRLRLPLAMHLILEKRRVTGKRLQDYLRGFGRVQRTSVGGAMQLLAGIHYGVRCLQADG